MDEESTLDDIIKGDKKQGRNRQYKSRYDNNYNKRSNYRSRSRDTQKNKNREVLDDQFNTQRHKQLNLEQTFIVQLKYDSDEVFSEFEKDLSCIQINEDKKLSEKDIPLPNINLGEPFELNKKKEKIEEIKDQWDKIKLCLNDLELIDIFRPHFVAQKRYALPIPDYRRMDKVYSKSYYKLWEILRNHQIMDNFYGKPINIACLAEGPGGFIQSLVDYRQKQHDPTNRKIWRKDIYRAITQKAENETATWNYKWAQPFFEDLKKLEFDVVLSYGEDDGNILDLKNLTHFMETDWKNQKVDLVTGDGGVEVVGEEYNFQELCNSKLFYAQIVYAFNLLNKDGCFIVRLYESYYDITLQMIQLLCLHFKIVEITKPLTSRNVTYERYLVCQGFIGISEDQLLVIKNILQEWINM